MGKFKTGNEVTLVKDTFDNDVNHRLNIQPQVIIATKNQLNGLINLFQNNMLIQ